MSKSKELTAESKPWLRLVSFGIAVRTQIVATGIVSGHKGDSPKVVCVLRCLFAPPEPEHSSYGGVISSFLLVRCSRGIRHGGCIHSPGQPIIVLFEVPHASASESMGCLQGASAKTSDRG